MKTRQKRNLPEWRCPNCHYLWFKGVLGPGSVLEVKCPKCNAFYFRDEQPSISPN